MQGNDYNLHTGPFMNTTMKLSSNALWTQVGWFHPSVHIVSRKESEMVGGESRQFLLCHLEKAEDALDLRSHRLLGSAKGRHVGRRCVDLGNAFEALGCGISTTGSDVGDPQRAFIRFLRAG